MKADRYLRGSTEQCPKCGCRKVGVDPTMTAEGYGPGLATCANCKTLWEPFDPAQIWDKSDPYCSFREPCNNCAFRPGSNEQQDREKWRAMLDQLQLGGQFYCHKGVPITAGAKHGFAYPMKTTTITLGDVSQTVEIEDTSKMRLCRGFLRAMIKLREAGDRKAARALQGIVTAEGADK